MMRSIVIIAIAFFVSLNSSAQDFSSLFLKHYDADSIFTQVTVSPKMMAEIMKSEVNADKVMSELIPNLKSMRILTSEEHGSSHHFQRAVALLEEHPRRFTPLEGFENTGQNNRVVVRKKRGNIVELIMLNFTGERFVLIDFTGIIKPEFISALTRSLKPSGL